MMEMRVMTRWKLDVGPRDVEMRCDEKILVATLSADHTSLLSLHPCLLVSLQTHSFDSTSDLPAPSASADFRRFRSVRLTVISVDSKPGLWSYLLASLLVH